MAFYESIFIVRPDASPQQVENLAGEMETLIQEGGGQVPKTEIWGLKSLAYRIKKNRKGHYVFMNVDAPAQTLGELERNLRFNEDILRYMSVRVDHLESEVSPMMRNKSSRDDRSIRQHHTSGNPSGADDTGTDAGVTNDAASTTVGET